MDKRESKKYYKKIIITGLVQGIGFRPLIYNMANDLNLKGYVKNIGSAVEIMLYATHMEIDTLITQIKQSNLPLLKIESIEITEGEQKEYKDFTIKQSSIEKQDAFFLLPDLPLCEECLKEINQSNNRRYKHGLNSCTLCGPRFSILKKVPYDRINTTMNQFPMCETCKSEYSDNTNRRFHAQTVSCHDCGPQIIFKDKTTTFHDEYAMEKAIIYLKNGGIIAIKGIGGYHLVCSPYNNDTVKKLRQLKGRETKPFAIMFKNIEEIKNHCGVQNLSKKEEEALLSNERSIIIIDNPNNSFAYEVLGKSTTCGCFLPYTPIQHLLFENFDALIVTSANIHSSTILYKDSEMLNFLKTSKEEAFLGILYHHREIIRSVEDSVSKLIKADNKIQIIRRGRGYTPLPIPLQNKSKKTILALGGDLKSSFTILKSNKAYVSQYFGDLEDIGINDEYTNSITDYINLLDASIDLIATDLHPSYHSTSAAKKIRSPNNTNPAPLCPYRKCNGRAQHKRTNNRSSI